MRILLDTHALLWWLLDDARLSERARGEIRDSATTVLVSSASGWEIATKHRLGKLGLRPSDAALPAPSSFDPRRLPELILRDRVDVLPISIEHALEAGLLPGPHRDPFDRMLVAQCRLEGLPLVTIDPVFRAFDVEVIW